MKSQLSFISVINIWAYIYELKDKLLSGSNVVINKYVFQKKKILLFNVMPESDIHITDFYPCDYFNILCLLLEVNQVLSILFPVFSHIYGVIVIDSAALFFFKAIYYFKMLLIYFCLCRIFVAYGFFSRCGEQGCSLLSGHWLFIAVTTTPAAERGL